MATAKTEQQSVNIVTWEDIADRFKELAGPEAATVVDTLYGTWKKKERALIVGVISHLYTWEAPNDDGEISTMYGMAVELKAPCEVNDGATPIAPEGAKVGITLSRHLKPLLHLRPGDTVAVYCLGEANFKSKDGKTRRTWDFKVKSSAQPRKEPMAVPDLPF